MLSNIWKYYVLRVFTKQMIVPVFVIYLLSNGISPIEIGTILSIGTIIGLLFEVPSGFISDRVGHKSAIAIAFLLQSMAMLFYALGSSFWPFLVGMGFYVAGASFWSGTGSAFLFETLKNVHRENEYEKIEGRSSAISQPISAIFLIIVPFLYLLSNASVFYLNFSFLFFCFVLSFTLIQPQFVQSVSDREGFKKIFSDIQRIWKYIINHKKFTALTFVFSVNNATQNSVDEFMQIYFNFIGIPQKFFGLIYASHRVLQGVGSSLAHKAKQKLNEFTTSISLTAVLTAFALFASIARHWFGFIIFPIRNFFEGLFEPIQTGLLNKEITEGDRATLLSISSLLSGLMKAVITFILGVLFEKVGVSQTFLITAIFVFISMSTSSLWVRNTRDTT